MIIKKRYQHPTLEIVPLDNEISLTLDSTVPWEDPQMFSVTDVSEGVVMGPELL
jgi:hypothetical protein